MEVYPNVNRLRLQNAQVTEYGKLRYGIDGYGLADKDLVTHMSDEFTINGKLFTSGRFARNFDGTIKTVFLSYPMMYCCMFKLVNNLQLLYVMPFKSSQYAMVSSHWSQTTVKY